MYYEVVTIREYNKNKPYCQIRLKKSSKFNKPSEVALIDVSEIKKIKTKLESIENNEAEVKYNKLKNDYDTLIKELEEIKEEKTNLETEASENKNIILELQNKILALTSNNNDSNNKDVIEAKNIEIDNLNKEIIKLKDKIITEKTNLANEKDFSKACLIAISDYRKLNLFTTIKNKLLNKEPSSVSLVNSLKNPEIIEAEVNNNHEE